MFGMNDPFFDNHFNLINNFMMSPFGSPFAQQQQQQHQQQHQQQLQLQQQQQQNQRRSNNNGNRSNQLALRNNFDPFAISPFNMHNSLMAAHRQAIGDPFAIMNQMMGDFNTNIFSNMEQSVHNDPNAQVFSSSSVISYSNTGDGKPKVFQASSQTRQAGGVKETRKMVRDSERGLEKVAVGHHIGERAHVIERQKVNNGPVEEIVNLENIDDGEVEDFNREFENKIHHYGPTRHHRSHLPSSQPFAIEDASRSRKDRKSKSKSRI